MSLAPRVVEVIVSQVKRGCGVTYCLESHEHEPVREVVQYHDLNGNFLAEYDIVLAEKYALKKYVAPR